jgi:hypothetical protein
VCWSSTKQSSSSSHWKLTCSCHDWYSWHIAELAVSNNHSLTHWIATGRWFSPGPPVSYTNKTDCHDITEILLKVALNTIKQTNIKVIFFHNSILFTDNVMLPFIEDFKIIFSMKNTNTEPNYKQFFNTPLVVVFSRLRYNNILLMFLGNNETPTTNLKLEIELIWWEF